MGKLQMNYKYIFQLSKKYIQSHKTMFIPFIIVVFLSTFLLTTIYVVKDSYDYYNLQISEKQYGKWDFSYFPQWLSSSYSDELDFIKDNTEIKMYENPLAYEPVLSSHSGLKYSFNAVSSFESLPIIMLEGNYPANQNEILVANEIIEQYGLQIGNNLTFQNEYGDKKEYKIIGIYEEYGNSSDPVFYTYLEDKTEAFTIYADFKDEATLKHIIDMTNTNPDIGYQLNSYVVNAKYHLNDTFSLLYSAFTVLIYIGVFLFIFNSLNMYMKKKESYLHQLFTLGATKKQIRLSLFFEFFLVCGICFLSSFFISVLLWKGIFIAGGTWLQNYLQLSFAFTYVLTTEHFVFLFLFNILIFLLCFVIVIWKNRKQKTKKLHYRSITLKHLPFLSRLSGLEIIRTGFGTFIIAALVVCSVLFQTTQMVVEYWIKDRAAIYHENADITTSFDLFNHNSKDISQFITEVETICEINNATTCSISYGVQSKAVFGFDTTLSAYSINQSAYQTFFYKHHLTDEDTPILVYRKESPVSYEELNMHILTVYQEELDTIPIEYQIIQDEELMESFIYEDAIVLLPPTLTAQWIDTYSNTYVNGSLVINSENHKQIAEQLNTIPIIQYDDHMYVNDNAENLQQFYRDTSAIRIFIYGLNFSVLAVCIFIIYNILAQYCLKNKREMNLLMTLGMTKRKIKHFFIFRAVTLSAISFVLSAGIELIILAILHEINLSVSFMDYIIVFLIDSFVLIFVIIILTLATLKKYILTSR